MLITKAVVFKLLLSDMVFGRVSDHWSDEKVAVEMMSHSFSSPFAYDSSRDNWFLGGSAVGVSNVRSSLILNPPIGDRHGIVLNKKIMESLNDFDLTLTMHLDSVSTSPDQTFTLILSSRNMTADLESSLFQAMKSEVHTNYIDSLTKLSMDKRTMLPTAYEGVAIVFSLNPMSVSIVSNDGKKEMKYEDSAAFKPDNELYVRIRIRTTPKSVSVLHQDHGEWKKITEKEIPFTKEKGYIGMTSFSGSGKSSYRVRLTNFHFKYFPKQIWQQPLLTQQDQIVVINSLIHNLHDHSESSKTDFLKFQSELISLQNRASQLEQFLLLLLQEVRVSFGTPQSGTSLMEQIKSIHSAISATDSERDVLMRAVQVAAYDDLEDGSESVNRHLNNYQKQFSAHESQLNDAIESNNRWTLGLILIFFITAFGMGLVFYFRLNRYAEKAHLF